MCNSTEKVIEHRNQRNREIETTKKIALETVEIFKSNNLNLMQINATIDEIDRLIKCRAHL